MAFISKETTEILQDEFGLTLSDEAVVELLPGGTNKVILPAVDTERNLYCFSQSFEYRESYENYHQGILTFRRYDTVNQRTVSAENEITAKVNREIEKYLVYGEECTPVETAVLDICEAFCEAGRTNRYRENDIPDYIRPIWGKENEYEAMTDWVTRQGIVLKGEVLMDTKEEKEFTPQLLAGLDTDEILDYVDKNWYHGSGLNGAWDIEQKDNTLLLKNEWENMNEVGMYDWTVPVQFVFAEDKDGITTDVSVPCTREDFIHIGREQTVETEQMASDNKYLSDIYGSVSQKEYEEIGRDAIKNLEDHLYETYYDKIEEMKTVLTEGKFRDPLYAVKSVLEEAREPYTQEDKNSLEIPSLGGQIFLNDGKVYFVHGNTELGYYPDSPNLKKLTGAYIKGFDEFEDMAKQVKKDMQPTEIELVRQNGDKNQPMYEMTFRCDGEKYMARFAHVSYAGRDDICTSLYKADNPDRPIYEQWHYEKTTKSHGTSPIEIRHAMNEVLDTGYYMMQRGVTKLPDLNKRTVKKKQEIKKDKSEPEIPF